MTALAGVPGYVPRWAIPTNVRAWISTREQGASRPPFSHFNLANHVGDDPAAVAANRATLEHALGYPPRWLTQVHGTIVVEASSVHAPVVADAAVTRQAGVVCTVMTADCLPILLASRNGKVIGIAHAGWRGLAAGVVEATVRAMACDGAAISAYLGPAIGPERYEVGADVRDAFVALDRAASAAFKLHRDHPDKFLCDLYELARQRLFGLGISAVAGGESCTVRDERRYFSYRRDGRTGRMATMIWMV